MRYLFYFLATVLLAQSDIDGRVFELFTGDLNGDTKLERVYKVEYGRTFVLHIDSNSSHLTIPLNDTEYVYIKDIDKDGIYEIISYDSSFSMLFGLCRACSPAVEFVSHYHNDRLQLQPKLIKTPTYAMHKVPLILDQFGFLCIDENVGDIFAHAQVIEAIITYFYKAEAQKALTLIKRYIPFASRSMRVLFLQKLIDTMSQSYFWEQIKELNSWDEYSNSEIVSELFRKLEQ